MPIPGCTTTRPRSVDSRKRDGMSLGLSRGQQDGERASNRSLGSLSSAGTTPGSRVAPDQGILKLLKELKGFPIIS
jgi:hypothetical protein